MLRAMDVREVPLSGIDFEDQTFRISEELDLDRMVASLRAVGQISPVLLLEEDSRLLRIVCGFRRLHGLRSLSRPEAAARILRASEFSMAEVFAKAVWDNISHRRLGPLEVARVLTTLHSQCQVDEQTLIERFLPALGLSPHRNLLYSYLSLHQIHPDLRRLVSAGHLTPGTAERLARLPVDEQARVAPVLIGMRLTAAMQRELLDLLEDLAAISDSSPAKILADPQIGAIVADARFSAFQKGEKVYELLYGRRNPRLAAAREAFQSEKAQLSLPGSVRLAPDPFFEKPRLRVEFDVGSAQAFRETVEGLQRSCNSAALDRLFQI